MVKQKYTMSTVAYVVAGLVAIIGVNVWAANADTVRNAAMSKFEDCIQTQYHTKITILYSNDGYLPDCASQEN